MALSFNKMMEAIDIVISSGHTPCIVGLQGIGKSDLVAEYAKNTNREIETITCSLLQEGDMAMPYTVNKNGESDVLYAINDVVKSLVRRCESSNKEGILFLDELNRGSSQTQSELMNLVLQRRIISYKLPDFIKVITAMNPNSEMKGYENTDYSVSFSDSAIMGRVLKLDMAPVLSEWLKYGEREDTKHNREMIHFFIKGYLGANRREFTTKEVSGEINNTPRGWSRASDVLYQYESTGIKDYSLLYELLAGTLRSETATSFLNYYKANRGAVNYAKLAKEMMEAENPRKWNIEMLNSLNDAEVTTLFMSIAEYCNEHIRSISDNMLHNIVTYILSATNNLIYAWVSELKEGKYSELYRKLLSNEDFSATIISIGGSVKNRKSGGFVGK